MMKSLIPWLSRMMPLMMAAFLILAVVQLAMMVHITPPALLHALYEAINWARPGYLPIGLISLALSFAGMVYYQSSERLALRGLRHRKSFLMDVLSRLTNRTALEEMLARQQRESTLNAEELAASLRARVIGQDQVCEDIAQQLRRRLALHNRNRPVGVFLLAGPPGTGKTYLAKQIAHQTERPLLHFDMTQMSSPHAATQLFGSPKGYVGSDTFGRLTGGLKESPDAVVLLDEIEKAHPDVFKKFLTAWNDGYVTEASTNELVSTTRAIFVLTSNVATEALSAIAEKRAHEPEKMRAESTEALLQAGFAPEVLNRLDRIFVFRALKGLDLARVAALEIEEMIRGYGLHVEAGGIDPALLFEIMQKQQKLGSMASARDLLRSIEDMISDSLITARQQGHTHVRMVMGDDGRIHAETSEEPQERLNKASL